MHASTNSLVARIKTSGRRIAVPAAITGALVLGAALLINSHTNVHAASFTAAPLDDNSVSSLVALDNAVESVAARVTPAVVNIAVTSKSNGEMQTGDGDDDGNDGDDGGQQQRRQRRQFQGQGQGQQIPGLPPGFSQFFGPFNFGQQMPQGPQVEHGIGSGVIISPDGYIVTNNHVIEGRDADQGDAERPPRVERQAGGDGQADGHRGGEGGRA